MFDFACSSGQYANLGSLSALCESEQNCAKIRPDVGGVMSCIARKAMRRAEVRVVSNPAQTASTNRPNHVGCEVLQDGAHVRIGDRGCQYESNLVNE